MATLIILCYIVFYFYVIEHPESTVSRVWYIQVKEQASLIKIQKTTLLQVTYKLGFYCRTKKVKLGQHVHSYV